MHEEISNCEHHKNNNYSCIAPFLCYSYSVNESQFINKIHKKLSTQVYRWKINDPYHGGVADAYYSGPAASAFVEYKYKPILPVKDTSKINFGLSKQQELWLTTQVNHQVPVYVVAGCENKIIQLTTNFGSINTYTKKDFTKDCIDLDEWINTLQEHCLHTNGKKDD